MDTLTFTELILHFLRTLKTNLVGNIFKFVKLIYSFMKSWFHVIFVKKIVIAVRVKLKVKLFRETNLVVCIMTKLISRYVSLKVDFTEVLLCIRKNEIQLNLHSVEKWKIILTHSVVISENFPHCKNFSSNWLTV